MFSDAHGPSLSSGSVGIFAPGPLQSIVGSVSCCLNVSITLILLPQVSIFFSSLCIHQHTHSLLGSLPQSSPSVVRQLGNLDLGLGSQHD